MYENITAFHVYCRHRQFTNKTLQKYTYIYLRHCAVWRTKHSEKDGEVGYTAAGHTEKYIPSVSKLLQTFWKMPGAHTTTPNFELDYPKQALLGKPLTKLSHALETEFLGSK